MIEWQSKEDELIIALPAPTMSDGEEGALEVEADLVFLEPPLSPLPGGLLVGAGLTDGIADGGSVIASGPILVGTVGLLGSIVGDLEGSKETDGA